MPAILRIWHISTLLSLKIVVSKRVKRASKLSLEMVNISTGDANVLIPR